MVGLVLAGGILLLWVAWRMYREIRHKDESAGSDEIVGDEHSGVRPAKTFASAAWGVALADVSMSLDNVLAVAGAAREHPYVLVFGLVLSVLLMGVAANFIARYIDRYRWIAWGGLVVILWVALQDDLRWRGPRRAGDRAALRLTRWRTRSSPCRAAARRRRSR